MGRVFFAQLAIYPSYLLVVGLWGGPYLTHVYGYDLAGRGDILFSVGAGPGAGLVPVGARRTGWFGSCKVPVLISLSASAAARCCCLLQPSPMPFPLLVGAFALIGFSTGPLALVLAHGRSLARAAPARAHHHAAQHRHHGRRIPGSVHQRRDHRPVPDRRLAPTRWRPTGWCSRLQAGSRSDRHYCLFRQPGQALRPKIRLCVKL